MSEKTLDHEVSKCLESPLQTRWGVYKCSDEEAGAKPGCNAVKLQAYYDLAAADCWLEPSQLASAFAWPAQHSAAAIGPDAAALT